MAIDPKELRIGNIVSECEEWDAPEWYQTVVGIVHDDVYLSNGDIEKSANLYPVRITEKELLRLGFVRENEWVGFIGKARIGIRFFDGNPAECDVIQDDKFIALANSRIKYFHHLQNLYFALTGEELVYEYDD